MKLHACFSNPHSLRSLVGGGWLLILLSASFNSYAQGSKYPQDNQKWITEVYKKITREVGDYRAELPKIKLRAATLNVASYNSIENIIYIEQGAVEVCRNMPPGKGASALAFLIGHELVHFYQKHDWGSSGETLGFLSPKKAYAEQHQKEAEADRMSAFYCEMAGYGPKEAIPIFLDSIYDRFGIEDGNLRKYPPLAERKKSADQICAQVDQLKEVYLLANYFYVLGKSVAAAKCYQNILKYVKCKELHNNLGVAALSTAIKLQGMEKQTYVYPLELEPRLPIRTPESVERQELLRLAFKHLSLATKNNSSYLRAYFNLISAYLLEGQLDTAHKFLKILDSPRLSPRDRSIWYTLMGILYAKENERNKAEFAFKEAAKKDRSPGSQHMSHHNLSILEGKEIVDAGVQVEQKNSIEGFTLTYEPRVSYDRKIRIHTEELSNQILSVKAAGFDRSRLISYEIEGVSRYSIILTANPENKTAKGAYIRMSHTQLITLHGSPSHISRLGEDSFFIYRNQGLIFKLNKVHKIVEWGIFAEY